MNQARRGLTTEEAALLRETKGANVYEKLKRALGEDFLKTSRIRLSGFYSLLWV